MPFSTDRDLLALEPSLFNDVAFVSQKRLEVSDGVVSGATLTSAAADFEAAQIAAGDVVLVAGVACEVLARADANTLTISKVRGTLGAAAIPPGDGAAVTVIHRTFEPQAELVHDDLLRLLGIDPDGNSALTEDAIVSLSVMRRLESIKTVAQVYDAAAALGAEENNKVFAAKAAMYHEQYRRESRRCVVHLDLNGDGEADTWKDMGLVELLRV